MISQVEQSKNRVSDDIPSVQDFILMRRETFGSAMAEGFCLFLPCISDVLRILPALMEYSLDLDIPEYIWSHPVLVELSNAAMDIMTWPNVSC